MAFMVPVAEYFTESELYQCDRLLGADECGECGQSTEWASIMHSSHYTVCKECAGLQPGWYARLSAPGYMDATDWHGPYATEEEALKAVCDFYEVDEDGEELVNE